MKTLYRMPSGPLGRLKEIHLETVLTTAHFDELAVLSEEHSERGVLSVMADLMDEDPNLLTMRDLYYAFLLVKVSSFGPDVPISVTCAHQIVDKGNTPRLCGYVNKTSFSLAEADVMYAPEDMEAPRLAVPFVCMHGSEEHPVQYEIRLPTMADELDLIAMYQELGYLREQLSNIYENRALVIEYSRHRLLLHLVSKETGEGFSDRALRAKAMEELKGLPVTVLREISDKVGEVDKFGVVNKHRQVICGGCGHPITFRTGLLAGLTM